MFHRILPKLSGRKSAGGSSIFSPMTETRKDSTKATKETILLVNAMLFL